MFSITTDVKACTKAMNTATQGSPPQSTVTKPPTDSKRKKHALKILWAVDGYQFNGGGYGFSIHRLKMKQALVAAGVILCFDQKDDFDIAAHIVRPDRFNPVPGKRNLLIVYLALGLAWRRR